MSTQTMTVLERMQRVCRPDEGQRHGALFAHPFAIHHTSGYWTIATDKRLLVAVGGVLDGVANTETNAPDLNPFLAQPKAWEETIPVVLLREAAGPAVWKVSCPQCKGSGGCSFCDGELEVDPEPRKVAFLGRVYDANLIARALDCLDGDGLARVAVTWMDGKAKKSAAHGGILFESADLLPHGQAAWRFLVMPMNGPIVDEPPLIARHDSALIQQQIGMVRMIATVIREDRDWAKLPILSDACESCGCEDTVLLDHLRAGGSHGERCWAVECLLGETT